MREDILLLIRTTAAETLRTSLKPLLLEWLEDVRVRHLSLLAYIPSSIRLCVLWISNNSRCCWWLGYSCGRLESLRRKLRYRAPPSDSLNLLDLKFKLRLFSSLLAESLILLIDVENQLLDMIACDRILVIVLWADTQMQGLVTLFLFGALFEARALTS